MKWKTITAIIAIVLSLVMNWHWIWGILFLYWVIGDLKSGVAFIVEPIYRGETPILYWTIILLWAFLSIYTLSYILV